MDVVTASRALAVLFIGYVVAWPLRHADRVPHMEERYSFAMRLRSAGLLLPVMFLLAFVIGSICVGWATATEAACPGVAGALVLSAPSRSLTWTTFRDALVGATRTCCAAGLPRAPSRGPPGACRPRKGPLC